MNASKDSRPRPVNTGEANPALAVYLDNLHIQLRLREVSGERIGQILAEVETHVADTALDPVKAFGEPGEYAESYVGASSERPTRGWLPGPSLRLAVPFTLAGWAILEGGMHFAGLTDITVRSIGVLVVLAAGFTAVAHALKAQLGHDTAVSSKSRKFTILFMALAWGIWLVGVAVLVLVPLLLPSGPTLVSVPGWSLVVAGLVAFLTVVLNLGGDRVVDPRG